MELIRVFPRRTHATPDDELAFIGDPPIIGRPPLYLPVHISCCFTWDISEAQRLKRAWEQFYPQVRIGGPALSDPGGEFMPGRFLKPGVTITSRGCPKKCPWCFVPEREGKLREIPIQPGNIIQDNNLLACSKGHVERVFDMLRTYGKTASFPGGLDADYLTRWHVELLDSITVEQMFFAYDHYGSTYHLEKAAEMLAHYRRYKKRCYVLIGFNGEPIESAKNRLIKIWNLGFMPFAMPYNDGKKRKRFFGYDWNKLIKTFSRPALTKIYMNERGIE